MNGKIKQAYATLRQFINQTLRKIGIMMMGSVVFKVFEGKISAVAIYPHVVVSPGDDSGSSHVKFTFSQTIVIPESVRRAVETLMLTGFGRVVFDIKSGCVRKINTCCETRYACN